LAEVKRLEGIRALVVEDDESVRQALLSILRRWGVQTQEAQDGQTGYERFEAFGPNLVITDIRMPHMDGLKMVRAIRAIDPHIAVVMVTAYSDQQYLLDAIDLGVDQLVIKPVDTDRLYRALEKIHARIQMGAKVQQQHQYYDALMASTIVSKTDTAGTIVDVNENFCRISGFTREELIGQPHNIVRHPDMPASTFKALWETIQAGRIWHGQVKNRTKEGGYYVVNATIVPLFDTQGRIEEYISIRQDMTDLEKLREQVISERERQKSAQAIAKARESFLVVFTHELKTPLNAIINFTGYVKKHLMKSSLENREKLAGLLDNVRSNAHYMLENITNILDMAKLKSGKLAFHRVSLNLHHLIEQMMARHEALLEEQGAVAHFEGKPECYVNSDELRLRQVLSNLYSNAIKYGNGKILVTLRCEGPEPVITVEDDGPGIADKPELFELFEQGDASDMTRDAQGTGIGLHFVRLLCEGLGMQWRVLRSARLGGTCFELRFSKQKGGK
jgi:PAS domain S-box-containing protein